MANDINEFRNWITEEDIVIVDRVYRVVIPRLEELGLITYMPPLHHQNQRQLSTSEANRARLITKTRWVVEARNGHFKSIFKFFKGRISMHHAVNLSGFYQIAGALLNKFHPLINLQVQWT